jgi:5-methylcytosine-specific restriction endonuclease McrA
MATEFIPYDGPIVTIAEARAKGLKRYFTGKPCKRGHLAQRNVSAKKCFHCQRLDERKRPPEYVAAKRATAAKWQKNNAEKRLEQGRNWYAKHTKEIRTKKRSIYKANPERGRGYAAKWRANNPEKVRAQESNRRARKRSAEGRHTAAETAEIRHAQKGRCAYCKTKLGGGGHLDHIVPLAKGGSNWPSNLQWLCRPCNLRKNDKDPIDFAKQIGMLL